ncbi:MAG: methyltransferase [Pseudomonadota bacterium]
MLSKYHLDVLWKLKILPNFIEFKKDDIIMDAGCGDGYIGSQVAKKVANVVGVDWDILRIKRNEEIYNLNNLVFLHTHLGNLSIGEHSKRLSKLSFTKIINLSALEHIEHPETAIENFANLLTKNGELLLLVPLGPGNGCRITKEFIITAVKKNLKIKEYKLIRAIPSLVQLRMFIIKLQTFFGYKPEPEENRYSENISFKLEKKQPLILWCYKVFVSLVIKPFIFLNRRKLFREDDSLIGMDNPDFMRRPIMIIKGIKG